VGRLLAALAAEGLRGAPVATPDGATIHVKAM
jgi:hypothetical protein